MDTFWLGLVQSKGVRRMGYYSDSFLSAARNVSNRLKASYRSALRRTDLSSPSDNALNKRLAVADSIYTLLNKSGVRSDDNVLIAMDFICAVIPSKPPHVQRILDRSVREIVSGFSIRSSDGPDDLASKVEGILTRQEWQLIGSLE
jgi:hypothetical protein